MQSDLRCASRIALLIGAAGSVALMLIAGRHNNSRLLLAMFTVWVISPYVALAAVNIRSRSTSIRRAIRILTLVITVAALAVYALIAFGPPRQKTAPAFVIVPPVSVLLLAFVVGAAALTSASRGRHSLRR